jgi:hypothetical protein
MTAIAATASPAEKIFQAIATATTATEAAVSEQGKDNATRTSLIKGMAESMRAADDKLISNTEPGRTDAEKEDLKNVRTAARGTEARQISVLKSMSNTFKSSFADLKGSLKQDFDLMTLGFSEIASSPGVRSIIALLKFIGLTLGKMLFTWVSGKFFKGLQSLNTDNSQNHKETLANFKEFFKAKLGMGTTELTRKGPGKTNLKPGQSVEIKDKEGPKGIFASMSTGFGKIKEDASKGMDSMKTGISTFFKPMTDGWGAIMKLSKKKSKEQQERWNTSMTKAFEPMTNGWKEMKESASEKFNGMRDKVGKTMTSMTGALKNTVSDVAKSARKMAKNSKAGKLLAKASMLMRTAMMNMGKALMRAAKRFIVPIAMFIISGLAFVGSMIAAAAAMMVPVLPIIGIVLALTMLGVGIYMLVMFIIDNWDHIKESFAIAFMKMDIWAKKATFWIQDLLSPIKDKMALFFASVMDGLANMINSAIEWINTKKKSWIGGGDIIDFRMEGGNVEAAEKQVEVRAQMREDQSEMIAGMESELKDREAAFYSSGPMAKGEGGGATVAVANTNINNTNQTHIQRMEPTDRYAGASSVAHYGQ